jgi:SAM-dependent methyltransferase
MLCKTLSPDDYHTDLKESAMAIDRALTQLGKGLPHEHRLWEYAIADQTIRYVVAKKSERAGTGNPINPITVLDVGGGRGPLAAALDSLGCIVTVVDPVLDDYENGMCISTIRGTTADIIAGSKRQWDVVLCVSVLEHVDDPYAVCHDIAQLAREAVVITVDFHPDAKPFFHDQKQIFNENMLRNLKERCFPGWWLADPVDYEDRGTFVNNRYNFASLVLVTDAPAWTKELPL